MLEVTADLFGFNLWLTDKTMTDDCQKMEQNFTVKNVNIMVLKIAFPVFWENFARMICSCNNIYAIHSPILLLEIFIYSVECATKSPVSVLSPREGANFCKFYQNTCQNDFLS